MTNFNTAYNIAPADNAPITLPTAASVPSLSSSAMLVHLSIGVWTASKKDKVASAEAADSHGADRKLARTYKTLIDSPKLETLKSLVVRIHASNRNATMDWAGDMRLLTTANYMKHTAMLTGFESEFWQLVDDFITTDYRWGLTTMQVKLGTLFNPADYPSEAELRRKFRFEAKYMPVPDAGDFRVDIANEAADVLREHYEKVYKDAIESAMQGLWQRLYGTLNIMSRQLAVTTDADGKVKKGRIFTSTLDAMRDLIDMLETCNLTGDPKMQRMQRQLAAALDGIDDVKDLKDEFVREDTKRAVDEAIANLPSLDF